MCMPAQSCPTLCNPKDYSPPGSSVFGIFQVRILEWVAISSSRESSQPKDQTLIPSFYISRWILYHWATQGSPYLIPKSLYYIALFYSIWANLDCCLLSMRSFFCVSYFIPQIRFICFSNSFICLASSYSCFKTQSKLFIIGSLALCKGWNNNPHFYKKYGICMYLTNTEWQIISWQIYHRFVSVVRSEVSPLSSVYSKYPSTMTGITIDILLLFLE